MTLLRTISAAAKSGFDTHEEMVKFNENMVLHAHFEQPLNDMAERIQYGGASAITAVIGPTGAGKSALSSEFAYQFTQASKGVPRDKCSTLLSITLPAPERGPFNWRDDLYKPALRILNEPCVDRKLDLRAFDRDPVSGAATTLTGGGSSRTIHDFREDFFSALERGRVSAMLIDEANHIRRPNTRGSIFCQYDSLKSRSDLTSTHFVLLGTTELADIFFQSGQISRRVFPIWMSPYSEKEMKSFLAALEAIQEKLSRPMGFSLSDKCQIIHEHVFGEFGLAHEWIAKALARAISRDETSISWKTMELMRYHEAQRAGIAREITRYFDVEGELRSSLNSNVSLIYQAHHSSPTTDKEKKSPRSTRPGTRKPVRDPVA